jgi:hypothetical protein
MSLAIVPLPSLGLAFVISFGGIQVRWWPSEPGRRKKIEQRFHARLAGVHHQHQEETT